MFGGPSERADDYVARRTGDGERSFLSFRSHHYGDPWREHRYDGDR